MANERNKGTDECLDARQHRDVRSHRLYPGVHDRVGAVSRERCRYGLSTFDGPLAAAQLSFCTSSCRAPIKD